MDKRRIYRSVIFFIIGVAIFWYVFRDTDIGVIRKEISQFSIFWIIVSVLLNIFSQWIRAHRWKLLFKPLAYSPKIYNLFLAVLILGFTNQVIPRGGEIARLATINRVEEVPFSKLFGLALAERLTDFVILILIFLVLLIWQFSVINKLIALPEIKPEAMDFRQIFIVTAIIVTVTVITILSIKKLKVFEKLKDRISRLKKNISEGFSSIYRIKRKVIYIIESLLIYLVWFFMLYVLFFAYPPTADLSFEVAMVTFGLATLTFLVPVQAGIGAWHFVVIQCLLLFGVEAESGKAFSLVSHAATNLIYLLLGGIAFIILPIINNNIKNR